MRGIKTLLFLAFAGSVVMSVSFKNIDCLVPEGWIAEEQQDYLKLTGPENDVSVYLTKLTHQNTVDQLKEFAKKFTKYPVLTETAVPDSDEWIHSWTLAHDVPVSESRAIVSIGRVYEGDLYAIIYDASSAGLSRRATQIGDIFLSWKSADMKNVSLAGRKMKNWTEKEEKAFDQFVSSSLKELCVPGAVLALATADKILFKKAYGVKNFETGELVTEKTMFKIGSITKSLTSLMIARLVEEGKVNWDDPIIKYLPDFRLADASLTQTLTFRDCVSSATGMPTRNAEMLFKWKGSAEDRIAELADMAPTTKYGEVFQYSNELVSLAGYAAARAVDAEGTLLEAYAKVMKEKVFGPLGMHTAAVRIADVNPKELAFPHRFVLNNNPMAFDIVFDGFTQSVAPAGNGFCSVDDLIKVVQLELSSSQSFISKDHLHERRRTLMKITKDSEYAHALFKMRQNGIEFVGHDGGTYGFSSMHFFIPELGIGFAMMVNVGESPIFSLFAALKKKLLELLLEGPQEAEKIVTAAVDSLKQQLAIATAKVSQDVDQISKLVEPILGKTFRCPELGNLEVTKQNDLYLIKVGDVEGKLAKYREEQPTFVTLDAHVPMFVFSLIEEGVIKLDMAQSKFYFRAIE